MPQEIYAYEKTATHTKSLHRVSLPPPSGSRIGFGTGGQYDDSNTCGNEASQTPDNGDKHIKAIGYILVH